MSKLDTILKEVWPRVRKRHFFPELPEPMCVPGEERVGLDIKDKKISISEKFVEGLCPLLEK
ncbi:MAG: hypothetical protein JRJ29_18730, partial [Deltaproteobacteria bacterium]|nr:hypothetical protein [Deltaproteobacteria bacterium]